MRLILVRHGQTSSNVARLLDTAVPGAPLTDTGLLQAEALVRELADEAVDVVVTSDLQRAQQTAAPLVRARDLQTRIDGDFREIQAGEDEMSQDFSRYMDALKAWAEGDPEAHVPGGENAVQFISRYDAAVARVEQTGASSAVVISHGAAIRTWIGHRASNLPAGFTARVRLDNTAIVVLEGSSSEGWDVITWCGVLPEEVEEAGLLQG